MSSHHGMVLIARDSGHAAINVPKNLVAIENGFDGVNLHSIETGLLVRTFPTGAPKKSIPRQVAFAEEDGVIVAGSDDGLLYVFDAHTGAPLDVLRHGQGGVGVQVIAVRGSHWRIGPA